VLSLRQAWEASRAGEPLAEAAQHAPELRDALAFFGR
jgi:ribulose-bisphosphate carboxylase large chain